MRNDLLRQDLPSRAPITQTCSLDHRHPKHIALGRARIARAHPRLDRQRLYSGAIAPLKALLNRDRARNRRCGALERHHQAIACVLHLASARLANGFPQQPEMLLSQLLGNDRPDSRLKLCGAHQVGDQDRDGLNSRAAHALIIRPSAELRGEATRCSLLRAARESRLMPAGKVR